MKQLLILIILPVIVLAQSFCTNKPCGAYHIGCRSYTRCCNNLTIDVDCTLKGAGYVFNRDTERCDDPSRVPPPCGVWKDCRGKKDGRYPDYDFNCTSFYTCFMGFFLGHNPCPADLVFDVDRAYCNYIWATKSPCGIALNM